MGKLHEEGGRGVLPGKLIVAVVSAAAALLAAAPASGAPGNPGVPGPPATVYNEDFENVDDPPEAGTAGSGTLEMLWESPSVAAVTPQPPIYQGAPPLTMSYESAPVWTNPTACNGVVMAELSANFAGVCQAGGFDGMLDVDHLRNMALAMGMTFGRSGEDPGDAQSENHVLSAVSRGSPGAPLVELETTNPVAVTSSNRFFTFSVDVAAVSCDRVADPLLTFSLLDYTDDPANPDEISVFGSAINPCTDPRGSTVDTPAPYTVNPRVGRYAPPNSFLFDGDEVGLRVLNNQGGGSGNDFAIDNVSLLDATPQLDKEFSPDEITLGETTTLVLTITNTDELAAKEGWSFTDSLAPGLTAANTEAVTDCPNATVDLELDGDTIDVAGDLDAGQESCTVEVEVGVSDVGTHENSDGNVSDLVGIDPPGPADLTCADSDPPVEEISDVFVECPFSDDPPATDFTIQQDWETEGATTMTYQTPVVGDLHGNGDPVVVVGGNRNVTGGSPHADRRAQDLHIFDGDDGALIDTIETPYYSWSGHSAVALADVTGDGRGEILFRVTSLNPGQPSQINGTPVQGRLLAYTYNEVADEWEVLWVSDGRYDHGQSRGGFGINVADFNGDDIPEVYVGNQIFNARTGVRLISAGAAEPAGCAYTAGADACYIGNSVAADITGGDALELVAGNQVYGIEITNPNGEAGNTVTSIAAADPSNPNVRDGMTSVADMDLDGDPDVIVSGRLSTEASTSVLYVWDGQADEILGMLTGLEMEQANGTRGSAPLVGDIDGDGRPEIVMVTTSRLRAFDLVPGTGLVDKWTLGVADGSGATSLSMFDFNSDGNQELVYRDQSNLRIIDGSGAIPQNLTTIPCSSGTHTDMPVIADITGSREARIVVTCGVGGNTQGNVRAFESASFPWASTRPVWNQQSYFVAHINDDLSVPASQFEHWTAFSDPDQRCSDGANRPLNAFQQQVTDLDSETGCPTVCPIPAEAQIEAEKEVANVSSPGDPADPGETLEYTITFENPPADPQGPAVDSAGEFVITDPIPAGTDYVPGTLEMVSGDPAPPGARTDAAGDDTAEYDAVDDEVVFRVGAGADVTDGGVLAPGEAVTVRFRAVVDADHPGGAVDNTATGTFRSVVLGEVGEASASASIPVPPAADLEVVKTADPGSVQPGEQLTFTLDITNHGPTDSPSGTVTDTLPAGVDYVSDDGGCDDTNLPELTCDTGPLAEGESTSIEIVVLVTVANGSLTNTAAVTGPLPDPDPSNNEDEVVTTIDPISDLGIVKAADPDPVQPGEQVTYTLEVTNHGVSDSDPATVTDTLPAGLTYISDDAGCDTSSLPAITCETGLLPNGASETIEIVTEVTATDGTVENSAAVTGPNTDSNPDNNQDSDVTTIEPVSDLTLDKRATSNRVEAGRRMRYLLEVTNNGPSDSPPATVTDTLPSKVRYVSDSAGCDTTGLPDISCPTGPIASGASETIRIAVRVRPRSKGRFANSASVTGPNIDPDPDNNADRTRTRIPRAKLRIDKRAVQRSARPGGMIAYRITIRNVGNGAARKVRVCDRMPSGLRARRVPGGTRKGSRICWTIGRLAAGARKTLRITAQVKMSAPVGTQRNRASVRAANATGRRTDTAPVRILPVGPGLCRAEVVTAC